MENRIFHYELIAISSIDYRIFLRSKKPEEKMFAILANFGNENLVTVITEIAASIANSAKGDLEKERHKNQLHVLAQLRTLVSGKIEIMEHVSTFFKEENDIFYRVGEKRGSERTRLEEKVLFVKNLLNRTDHPIAEIASLADVTETFVKSIKDGMR